MADAAAALRLVDDWGRGFGWLQEGDPMQRTSHALVAEGGVWIVDPVDGPGLDERLRAAGEPRGVIQLLDRHRRDGAALAGRLGVPLHVVPEGVEAAPFAFVPVPALPGWRETALWWAEERTLVVADALGTAPYFLAPGERVGVHPLLRLRPPRALARLGPVRVLCGHGEGVDGPETATAVAAAVRTARRRLPAAWLAAARGFRSS